ncbi:unnamed protein product [Phaeothamnion confervicola]
MLLLSKSCKLVPVMIMGHVIGGAHYKRSEYVAVALITAGVVLFSLKPAEFGKGSGGGSMQELIGLGLVGVNLLLDGVTNAQQDEIYSRGNVSSMYMMFQAISVQVNMWMAGFHAVLLAGGMAALGGASELSRALEFCRAFPAVVPNVAAFCACAAVGQLFIFYIIKEYGALVNVTCTITRKVFSILISVALFGHAVRWWQWCGIVAVFAGLAQSVLGKYSKEKKRGAGEAVGKTNANGKGRAGTGNAAGGDGATASAGGARVKKEQ